MQKAKQLALGLLFGLPPTHSIVKDLLADPDVVALAEIAVIDKKDFFSAEVKGKSFFEYSEVWEHMDNAVEKLRERGVNIQGKDFMQSIVGTKTALSIAFDQDVLKHIFTPVIWKGQLEAMQDAWYSLDHWSSKKDKVDFFNVQTLVAEGMGRTFRQGQLKKMGIEFGEVREAINSGNYDKLNKKLAEHGEHFRREDVFTLDKSGDHTLDTTTAWNHFGQLWDQLAKNGERLEVEDFLFKRAKRDSILQDAQECNGLTELFNPRLWKGRTEDVVRLYGMLTESNRAKVQIDSVLDELANYDYGNKFDCEKVTDHSNLTYPVNAQDEGKPNYKPIRPLALKTVWERIACVQNSLRQNGQSITLEDLRQKSGLREETCLTYAARSGNFDKVVEVLRESGDKLTAEELTAKDKDGKTIIDHLIKNNQLMQILQPRDWLGRGPELAKVWQAIPESARDKINFQQLVGTLNTMGLRERFGHRMPSP